MTIQTYPITEWSIERTGEKIMWGTGLLLINKADFSEEGYKLLGAPGQPDDEEGFEPEMWGLIEPEGYPDPDHEDYVGFAIGSLYRKMEPAYSPDITAIRLTPETVGDPEQ